MRGARESERSKRSEGSERERGEQEGVSHLVKLFSLPDIINQLLEIELIFQNESELLKLLTQLSVKILNVGAVLLMY